MSFHFSSVREASLTRRSATVDDTPEGLAAAQDALLDARARYKLRNDAVELVMSADPVLKAVHGGTNASPIERFVSQINTPDEGDVARS